MPQPTSDVLDDRYSATSKPGVFDFTSSEEKTANIGRQERLEDIMKFALPSVVAGMADTFGTSLGLVDDKGVENYLLQNYNEFGSYYARNKEAATVAGDLTGMFIPGLAAEKAIRGGGVAYNAISKLTGADSILLKSVFTSGKNYDQLLSAVKARDLYLARAGTTAIGEDLIRKQLARKAVTTGILDTVKKNVAFELGVAGTMNSSDTLFPDEYDAIDNIALAASLPTIFAGAETAFLRRQLRQSIQDVSSLATAARNPQDMPMGDIIFRPENRDVGITLYSTAQSAAQKEFDTARFAADKTGVGDDIRLKNFNSEILQLQTEVRDQIQKLGTDNPIKKLTTSKQLSPAQVKAAEVAQKQDPTSLLGTISIEGLGDDAVESIKNFYATRKELTNKLDLEWSGLNDKIIKSSNEDEIFKLRVQQGNLIKEKEKLESYETFVLEADGSISVARDRKSIFQDGNRKIQKLRGTENEPAYYAAKIDNEVFSVTEDGIAVIPEVKENMLAGVNVTQILPTTPSALTDLAEKQSKILFDLAKVYHPFHGQLGRPIYERLSTGLQKELGEWIGSSSASKIREWVEKNNPFYQELRQAMEPVRARLREVAGSDGTITLYRGENKQENAWIKKFREGDPSANSAQINDVVSMSSNIRTASAFGSGGHLIAKQVHVDDVVAIVGGSGDEFEFIVKGNRNRVFGDVVSERGFRALDLKKRSALYDAFQASAENYKPKGPGSLILTENDHHTRLDFAMEILSRHADNPQVAQSIKLPKGVNSLADLEYLSLSKKYEEYTLLRKMVDESNNTESRRVFNLTEEQKPTHSDIARMLNLPGTPTGDVHPILSVFEQFYLQGDASLSSAVRNVDDLHQMMQEEAFFPDLTAFKGKVLKTRGDMMNMPRDASPSLLIKKPLKHESYQREALFNMVRDNNSQVKHILATADRSGARFVQEIFNELEGLEASKIAKQVDSLNEGQQRSSNFFVQTQFAAGENAAMQAANLVENLTDRITQERIGKIFEPHLTKFAKVRSNDTNMRQFNLFVHARRQGWDLEAQPTVQDGLVLFPLRSTKANKERYEAMFGEAMPENQTVFMPGQTPGGFGQKRQYQPLGINQDTFEAINSVQVIGKEIYDNTNVLRRAFSRNPLNFKEFWVPPKNFYSQETVSLVTPDGRLHSIQHGRTIGEAKRKAEVEIKNSGGQLFLVDQNDSAKYFHLKDEAFERMLDFSDPLNQTGRAKGTSVGDVVEIGEDVLNDINETLNKQFSSITRRTRALYFEPQINYVRHMYSASGSEARKSGQSVWQHYIAAIYGNPTISPNEVVGKTYFTAESLYDDALNWVYDKKKEMLLGAKGDSATKSQSKQFDALNKELGNYNPFSDATDYAQRTFNVSLPPNMKQHMAKLNSFTSFLTLRMGEVGHAVLNLSSLAATTPAVIKSLKRWGNETPEQWKARIAGWGSPLDDEGMAMFNPYRASASAMHFMFTDEGRKVADEARKLGFFNQDVAEMFKTLTAPRQGYAAQLATKVGDMVSILSDKSEEISRGISFMMGYGIAKRGLGISEDRNAYAFAHNFANQVIGDYRPNNRPRIFQGAVGMPLGLFMTFTQNYFQRLFSYVENKQVGTLLTQYATQAAVFGAQTVPGFQQFNDTFVENYDGSINLVDGLQNTFGTKYTDLLLYGSLGNLPKLFGSDDGIAIHTRGDANIQRLPGIWNLGNTPGFQMLSNGYDLVTKTAASLKNNGGYNNQQIMEILGNYSQNRTLRNAFTLMSGYAVDRKGQVISDDIYSEMSLAARAVGMRPLSEAKKTEAWTRMRAGQLSQNAKMAELREAFRAGIRSGDMDEEQFGNLIQKYLKYGGNPNGIPRFLSSQMSKSLVDKSTLELMKAISDPSRMQDVKRLMNAQVLPQNDPYFEEGVAR